MRGIIYPMLATMFMVSAAAQAEESRAIKQTTPVATPENTAKPGTQNSKNMSGGSVRFTDSEFKQEGGSVTFPKSEFKQEGGSITMPGSELKQEGSSITVPESEFKQTGKSGLRPQTTPALGASTKEPIGEMPQEHKDKIAACESKCSAEVNSKGGFNTYNANKTSFTPPDPCSKLTYSEASCTPEAKKAHDEKQAKKKACFEKCMKQ